VALDWKQNQWNTIIRQRRPDIVVGLFAITHVYEHQITTLKPFDAHCCHMGIAIKHPVPDRIKPSFVTDIRALDVKNYYKWRLNPIWHRVLLSCTHMATRNSGIQRVKRRQCGFVCLTKNAGTNNLIFLSCANNSTTHFWKCSKNRPSSRLR